ncbi:MAG TPA: glycosyltransferase family 2 protein [Blastocatellia bacterium]|nr:glycosyltransferase family 2 protein [Blastocatellia bacterium]
MSDRPLLTIAISSHNRAAKLDSQIRWAAESIGGRWDECQLLVVDGASTDATPAVCERWKAALGERITCSRLAVNEGIVPGICSSIERSSGEYVWTVSDDDFIRADAVTTAINALRRHSGLGLLHLNHRIVDGISGELIDESFYPWTEDQHADPGRELIEKCLMHHEGGLQFMTANVVRRDLAVEAIKRWPEGPDNLAMPIYIYSYAAKDASALVVARPALDCVYKLSSWYDRAGCVYYKDAPEVLLRLGQVGFDRRVMSRVLLKRLRFKLITAKSLTKFFMKFPSEFARSIPYYLRALRDAV